VPHFKTPCLFLVFGIFLLPTFALAADDPSAGESAPQEEIVCSWSKMNTTQYKDCQKRKDAQAKLSEKEKREHNHELVKDQVVDGSNNHVNPKVAGQKDAGHDGAHH